MYFKDKDFLSNVANYISEVGIQTDDCLPYKQFLTNSDASIQCPSNCDGGANFTTPFKGTYVKLEGNENVQNWILENGPVVMLFECILCFIRTQKFHRHGFGDLWKR